MDIASSLAEFSKIFESRMNAYEERLTNATSSSSTSTPDIAALSREFAEFKTFMWDSLSTLKSQVELLSLGLDRHETYLRRKVLLLHGVPEDKDERTHKVAAQLISDKMKMPEVTPDDFEMCHRLGSNISKPRPILLRFHMVQQRREVWDAKSSLKGSGFTLSEFLTRTRHQVFMAARMHFGVNRCWSADGKINILLPDKSRRKVELQSDLELLMAKFPGQQQPTSDSQNDPPQQTTAQSEGKTPKPIVKPVVRSVRATRKK